jgi:hypothetical protein
VLFFRKYALAGQPYESMILAALNEIAGRAKE